MAFLYTLSLSLFHVATKGLCADIKSRHLGDVGAELGAVEPSPTARPSRQCNVSYVIRSGDHLPYSFIC